MITFQHIRRAPQIDPRSSSPHTQVRSGAELLPDWGVCLLSPSQQNRFGEIYLKQNNLCSTSFHNVMGHIITLILDLLTCRTVPSWFTWHDCPQLRAKRRPRKWGQLVRSSQTWGCVVMIWISVAVIRERLLRSMFFFPRVRSSVLRVSALSAAEWTYVQACAIRP